jgi:hypothetical protein
MFKALGLYDILTSDDDDTVAAKQRLFGPLSFSKVPSKDICFMKDENKKRCSFHLLPPRQIGMQQDTRLHCRSRTDQIFLRQRTKVVTNDNKYHFVKNVTDT